MAFWLLKSEPEEFSLADLFAQNQRKSCWDGVRNYQARNMLRDEFKKGDLAFFYHSNCAEPGIAGIVEVVREAYPDHTAFDPAHAHFDAKSDPENPRWFMVDVRYKRKLKRVVTLKELRNYADSSLSELLLLRRGNRLSVMPVKKREWDFIVGLEKKARPVDG
ncbi:MAG: EVE domain-containing protein [Gammaproteobacteria bacterium]|nr:EVE domain-containing protein [Gammaproteobacteria bacterium]